MGRERARKNAHIADADAAWAVVVVSDVERLLLRSLLHCSPLGGGSKDHLVQRFPGGNLERNINSREEEEKRACRERERARQRKRQRKRAREGVSA